MPNAYFLFTGSRVSLRSPGMTALLVAPRYQHFRRPQSADLDSIPIFEDRPQEATERRSLSIRHRQKSCDHRRHRDFGGTAGAVIAFKCDADAVLGQRAAIHAFGASLR